MRLVRFVVCAGLAACASLGLVLAADAGSDRSSITLRGVVPPVCTVSVSASNASVDLIRGQSQVGVATVEEQCNAAGGYVVSVTSKNGGQLLRADGGGVGYSLRYGDASVGQNGSLSAERTATGDVRRSTLAVSVPANPEATAGDYEDIVTISIQAR